MITIKRIKVHRQPKSLGGQIKAGCTDMLTDRWRIRLIGKEICFVFRFFLKVGSDGDRQLTHSTVAGEQRLQMSCKEPQRP